MANEKKCGYSQCRCTVPEHEHYCSDYCKDAQGEKEIEIQCDCKHETCALDYELAQGSCHLPQHTGKVGQTNGPCAGHFVLHNGCHFILEGNLTVLQATINMPFPR